MTVKKNLQSDCERCKVVYQRTTNMQEKRLIQINPKNFTNTSKAKTVNISAAPIKKGQFSESPLFSAQFSRELHIKNKRNQ